MRVTNQMMTNSALANLNKAQQKMYKIEEQYYSQMKIQRPSDDPVIAVRSLKLRTSLNQINQYLDNNIQEAKSWMDVTEDTMDEANKIFSSIYEQCTYGATGTLSTTNKSDISAVLQEYKSQIYQEANADYAGRYIFAGYKTNTSLTFGSATKTDYDITQKFTFDDFDKKSVVSSTVDVSELNNTEQPELKQVYRIRLGYSDNEFSINEDGTKTSTISINATELGEDTVVNTLASSDKNAYFPGDDEINYLPDTGEVIFGKNVYESIKNSSDLSITYKKTDFAKGDLRPEHYYDCVDNSTSPASEYTVSNQEIKYEINFGTTLTVNVQAKDTFTTDIGRDIDEITQAVNDVIDIENKITKIKNMMEDENYKDKENQEKLNSMLSSAETELMLKNSILTDAFSAGQTKFKAHQDTFNYQVGNLGSRIKRLELTEERLTEQKSNYTELLSNNEDADLEEVVINYKSADTVYSACLSVSAKIVKQTLLDFL